MPVARPAELSSPLRAVDVPAATEAAQAFLRALGVDTSAPGLERTAERMAHAYAELFRAEPVTLTTFPNDEGYDEVVLARGIPFRSVCEHHLLPFMGVAHVGYLPGARIIGLSKLARVVEHLSARPQVQERLTGQVARVIDEELQPQGVGVVLDAEHLCMSVRGVRATGATTRTSAMLGRMRSDARTRAEFLALTGAGAA
ncbi:GTP cyclohydrolase I FolE [Kineococcus sp. LSe6-4]|uniref:GTP cyclohydrolase 1 n=2 Tax=Kineococcus halophytocola TaxID=3234027 RepID=A0ABV4H232_9ACTN